jgi:DNA-binding transcriptional MerR regulator
MATKRRKVSKDIKDLQDALARSKELKRDHHTVSELISATGVTLRQVRNWREEGMLVPCVKNTKARGSQPAIFYSPKQVLRALVILELRNKGLTLKQIKRVESNLQKGWHMWLEDATKFLLTDGETAFYAETKTRVVDILKHENQLTLVDVWEHISYLKQTLRKVA